MNHNELTPTQLKFYDYIVGYKKKHRIWPTYREIMAHFEFRSKNSVYQMQQSLIKKGYLKKLPDGTIIRTKLRPGFSRDEL